jgi:hypothetical protein
MRFPDFIADFLNLERNKSRKFREETITDMLMAGLIGREQFGISVDWSPDEHVTGADMEWIFAAPRQGPNGLYIRLLIQAKRATYHRLRVRPSHWRYAHLNHDKGAQATALVNQAAAIPGTLPLYIFYHPRPALKPKRRRHRSIDGVNLVLAHLIEPLVQGRCPPRIKRVSYWRPHFMQLKHFLCGIQAQQALPLGTILGFLRAQDELEGSLAIHPNIISVKLQGQIIASFRKVFERRDELRIRKEMGARLTAEERALLEADFEVPDIRVQEGIPASIRRSINREIGQEEIAQLERPRVIFYTNRVLGRPDRD